MVSCSVLAFHHVGGIEMLDTISVWSKAHTNRTTIPTAQEIPALFVARRISATTKAVVPIHQPYPATVTSEVEYMPGGRKLNPVIVCTGAEAMSDPIRSYPKPTQNAARNA